MRTTRSLIVVPDGLAVDGAGRPLPQPSFVYRWVLDWVADNVEAGDRILLAPANKFGGQVSEQEAARRYLEGRGVGSSIVCFEADSDSYIDTRGNARLLREHLKRSGDWPPPRAILISYVLHLPRAGIVFRHEGFDIETYVAVTPPHFTAGPIVRRLWYYRWPVCHRLYEAGARLASRLRVI